MKQWQNFSFFTEMYLNDTTDWPERCQHHYLHVTCGLVKCMCSITLFLLLKWDQTCFLIVNCSGSAKCKCTVYLCLSPYPPDLAVRILMLVLSFLNSTLVSDVDLQLAPWRAKDDTGLWQSLPQASCVILGWQPLSIILPREAGILDISYADTRQNTSQQNNA